MAQPERALPCSLATTVAALVMAATPCQGFAFDASVQRSDRALGQVVPSAGPAGGLKKEHLRLADIGFGTPDIAAKRKLALAAEGGLTVMELRREGVPAAYGFEAFDSSPGCLEELQCEVRMRVLLVQGRVWYLARRVALGPFEQEADARQAMAQMHAELVAGFGSLAVPRTGEDSAFVERQSRAFLSDGSPAGPGHACHGVPSVDVLAPEPLAFPSGCGWSYWHLLQLRRDRDAFYAEGTAALTDLGLPDPRATEVAAREADAREAGLSAPATRARRGF